jgi:hypothetical protein
LVVFFLKEVSNSSNKIYYFPQNFRLFTKVIQKQQKIVQWKAKTWGLSTEEVPLGLSSQKSQPPKQFFQSRKLLQKQGGPASQSRLLQFGWEEGTSWAETWMTTGGGAKFALFWMSQNTTSVKCAGLKRASKSQRKSGLQKELLAGLAQLEAQFQSKQLLSLRQEESKKQEYPV